MAMQIKLIVVVVIVVHYLQVLESSAATLHKSVLQNRLTHSKNKCHKVT